MEKSQRLVYLDLTRVIAMVMMILGHSFFDLVRPIYVDVTNFPWSIWDFLRGLTAPIFLVVSGIVQVFANKRVETKIPSEIVYRRIRTSLLLIFLAYFLNFPVQKFFQIIFQDSNLLLPFFQVNILQLIGVTLLWILLYFLITNDNQQLGKISLLTGVVIFILTPFVHLVDWYKYLPLPIAPYLSLEKGSYFTIFPFSGFMFFGVAFGTYLQKFPLNERANVIIRKGLLASAIFIPLGTIVYFLINLLGLQFYDVFKANPGMSIFRLGCVGLLLSVIVTLYQRYFTNLNLITKISFTLGKNSLFVYVVHLLILYGLPWYPGFASIYNKSFSPTESFILSILVVIISFSLVFFYENFTSEKKHLKSLFKYGIVTLFFLMIFV